MSPRYSELANWDGNIQSSPRKNTLQAAQHAQANRSPATTSLQQTTSHPQSSDAFPNRMTRVRSSDDSAADEACVDNMLLPSSPVEESSPSPDMTPKGNDPIVGDKLKVVESAKGTDRQHDNKWNTASPFVDRSTAVVSRYTTTQDVHTPHARFVNAHDPRTMLAPLFNQTTLLPSSSKALAKSADQTPCFTVAAASSSSSSHVPPTTDNDASRITESAVTLSTSYDTSSLDPLPLYPDAQSDLMLAANTLLDKEFGSILDDAFDAAQSSSPASLAYPESIPEDRLMDKNAMLRSNGTDAVRQTTTIVSVSRDDLTSVNANGFNIEVSPSSKEMLSASSVTSPEFSQTLPELRQLHHVSSGHRPARESTPFVLLTSSTPQFSRVHLFPLHPGIESPALQNALAPVAEQLLLPSPAKPRSVDKTSFTVPWSEKKPLPRPPLAERIQSNDSDPSSIGTTSTAQATRGSSVVPLETPTLEISEALISPTGEVPETPQLLQQTGAEVYELSPEIPLATLPLASCYTEDHNDTFDVSRKPRQVDDIALYRAFVVIPSPPADFVREEYTSNTSKLDEIARDEALLASPKKQRLISSTPAPKRKRPAFSPSPQSRKRVRPQPLEEEGVHELPRFAEGFVTECYEGFYGHDPLDDILAAEVVGLADEPLYPEPDELEIRALRVSLRHVAAKVAGGQLTASKTPSQASTVRPTPVPSVPVLESVSHTSKRNDTPQPRRRTARKRKAAEPPALEIKWTSPARPETFVASSFKDRHKASQVRSTAPSASPPTVQHRNQVVQPPLSPSKAFVVNDAFIAATRHYSTSPAPSATPGITSDSLNPSNSLQSSSPPPPVRQTGIFDAPALDHRPDEFQNGALDLGMDDILRDNGVHPLEDRVKGPEHAVDNVYQQTQPTLGSYQAYLDMVPWAERPIKSGYPFRQEPIAGPSSHQRSLTYDSQSEEPHVNDFSSTTFGDGTIDPSILGGGPLMSIERTPSPVAADHLLGKLPSPDGSIPGSPGSNPSGTSGPQRDSIPPQPLPEQETEYSFPHSPKVTGKGKGKGKAKPSEEVLAAAASRRRRTSSFGSPSDEKRDRRPSARVLEALASVDYELTDDDADGETINTEELGSIVGHSVTRRDATVNQSKAKPRKRASQLEQTIAPNGAIPSEYCHQCRRKTQYNKMRCSAIREDGDICGLRFCERCIERRYPQMVFDSSDLEFTCPKCADYCNCTACCARRGETYISARDTLPSTSNRVNVPRKRTKFPRSSSTRPARSAKTSEILVSRTPLAKLIPTVPTLAVPPGMFWGTVYSVDGQRVGTGILSQDQQVLVAGEPRKVFYIGKPPPTLRRRGTDISISSNPSTESVNQGAIQNRLYIGHKGSIYDSSYKSLEDHLCSTPSPSSSRHSSPLTPLHDESSDPVALPPETDLGFIIARAIHSVKS
ncbi:unnamed protein product [Somion occarium]|uniref:Zinc-finger domain-containing protein n=1 Tax=Somion occarium TaxID=3059160 RepID=A0ABP1CN51_9APHY